MPTPQDLTDALNQVDVATTKVGAVVVSLRAQVKENMTPAEVAAVRDKLTAIGGNLTAMAHDPDEPVPPGPPIEPLPPV